MFKCLPSGTVSLPINISWVSIDPVWKSSQYRFPAIVMYAPPQPSPQLSLHSRVYSPGGRQHWVSAVDRSRWGCLLEQVPNFHQFSFASLLDVWVTIKQISPRIVRHNMISKKSWKLEIHDIILYHVCAHVNLYMLTRTFLLLTCFQCRVQSSAWIPSFRWLWRSTFTTPWSRSYATTSRTMTPGFPFWPATIYFRFRFWKIYAIELILRSSCLN